MPTSNQPNDLIRFAGDVHIDKVEIVTTAGVGQDITAQTSSIQVFEDLFSPFITGRIVVDDTLDLIGTFPLVGLEFVNIKITTPSFDQNASQVKKVIDGKFYIYKISEREYTGDKRLVYKLSFISADALVDMNKKISKGFQGRASDIAKKIIQNPYGLESRKDIEIESSFNGIKFTSNYWSPVKCLNYLAEHAVNNTNACNYLFFENRYGLNFKSIESMYTRAPLQHFIYDKYTRDFQNRGDSIKNIEEDYRRIEVLSTPTVHDYMTRLKNGLYASRIITHDLVTKKYQYKNFDYLNEFEKREHLNPNPLVNKTNIARPDAAQMIRHKHFAQFNGYTDVTNTSFIQRRLSSLLQTKANSIEITVAGRTDYTVGEKVLVTTYKPVPLADNESMEDNLDTLVSGNYLITNINHFITRDRHECVMDLCKDSLIYNLTSK